MVAFAREHRDVLGTHDLVGTGTTGRLVAQEIGLHVEQMLSGPIGGDVQIAGCRRGDCRSVVLR
jgi:methylglyoxal synthase